MSPQEVASVGKRALELRLATYEYRLPPYAGRRHLGFIIDDTPDSPAVDRDGDMVDLYGYATMLAAALQAQQQRINALETEVRDLRRELAPSATRKAHPRP